MLSEAGSEMTVASPSEKRRGAAGRGRSFRRVLPYIEAGALVVAGLFTLVPGRIMHRVIFGA